MSANKTELNEIRRFIRQVVNETIGEKMPFKIPQEIKSFYKISGDFSNVQNWKARIIENNSSVEGKEKGDWDDVGYVLISTTTNYIIPVARCDEHHTGYDLLYNLSKKYKIKDFDYQSVFLLGNHYVYGGEYHNKEVVAIKKAYGYGARDIIIKEMNGDNKSLNIDDYVANDGNFDQAIKNGKKLKKISTAGQNFIDELKNIVHLFEQYRANPLRQNPKFEENIINSCKRLDRIIFSNNALGNALRWNNEKRRKIYKSFDDAIENGDINAIENTLFNFDGLKNTIHVLLKKDDKKLEEFFWSNENALEQFNAMSGIR